MEAPTYSVSRHPDGKTFVWGGLDNMLHVVDYESGKQLEEYKGHFGTDTPCFVYFWCLRV